MKTLVTGSHGFIGSHLVAALEKRGDEICILSRDYLYNPEWLLDLNRQFNPDYIFHLAAYGNMASQKEDSMIFETNLGATFTLLESAKDIPYKAFVNVSSSSVLLPHQTMYSATKLGAEALCKAFVDEYNKPIVTVRPFSVYGPQEASFRFIPTVFRSCMTGEMMDIVGDVVHDWVYVDDVVNTLIDSASFMDVNIDGNKTGLRGRIVEAGTGIGTTNLEIMRRIEGITRKDCNYRFVNSMRAFDNKQWVSKEPKLPGSWTSLDEGLQKYYESIKS